MTYTREIDFDADGGVWTSNSNFPTWQIEAPKPKVIRTRAGPRRDARSESASRRTEGSIRPFASLRIVEIADESGAYCGKLFADLGPTSSRSSRRAATHSRDIGPFFGGVPDREQSVFVSHYNAGKRSVVLDLERERASLERLLDGADVLSSPARPSELRRRGLDPAALIERRPRLIVAAISPFGLDGPRAEWRSSDTVAQALGGMLYVNGHADEPPLRAMGLQAYHRAALQAAIGSRARAAGARAVGTRPGGRRERAGERGRRASST